MAISQGNHLDNLTKADPLLADLAAEFQKSIKFEYRNGSIGRITAAFLSTPFVLNIQKSIANIFQLTIKKSLNTYVLQEVLINHFHQCVQAKRPGTFTVFLI